VSRHDDFLEEHRTFHERQRARELLLRVVIAFFFLATVAEVIVWLRGPA